MIITGKRYPLIGVWSEDAHGKPARHAFATAYVDDSSYQAAYGHALGLLRHGAISVSLRAYALDHYGRDGSYTKGHSVTLDILDYRDLPENVSQTDDFMLAC